MPRFLRRCIYRYVPCNISNEHLLSDEIKLRLVIQIDRFYRREGRRVKSAIKATRVSINTRARFVPDETDVWNRSPLLPAAVDRLHLRRLRRWLQGEYRSLCVARTSFNIIIATSTFDGTRNRLPWGKNKEEGKSFHAGTTTVRLPRKRTIFHRTDLWLSLVHPPKFFSILPPSPGRRFCTWVGAPTLSTLEREVDGTKTPSKKLPNTGRSKKHAEGVVSRNSTNNGDDSSFLSFNSARLIGPSLRDEPGF